VVIALIATAIVHVRQRSALDRAATTGPEIVLADDSNS
jgi:hypothetical protein